MYMPELKRGYLPLSRSREYTVFIDTDLSGRLTGKTQRSSFYSQTPRKNIASE